MKYTVFLEVASEDDPPWMAYRFVDAPNVKKAIQKAKSAFCKSQGLKLKEWSYALSAWRVFEGRLKEVSE